VFDRYEDDWDGLAWVLIRGRASLVTDGSEKALQRRRFGANMSGTTQ